MTRCSSTWWATESGNLRELKPDPNPSLAAWFGMWSQHSDRIQIQPARDPSKVHLTGHAIWQGAQGVKHYGQFDGEAIPSGNHIHYSEGPDACAVALTLFGKYIVADDNEQCGGMNVRFGGIWTRVRK